MNKAKLADIYEGNSTVSAILDIFAERTYNSKVSLIKRIHFLLRQRGIVVSSGDLIAAFRLLQEAGCGIFVKGSRGYSSRFEWAVKTTLAAAQARETAGEQDEEDEEEDEDADEEDEEDEEEYELDGYEDDEDEIGVHMIGHSFVLRPDLRIVLRLPATLNETEADRLAQFAESLSFTDPFEGDEDEDEDEEYDDEEIKHSYVLRPVQRITLRLPADLTPREAIRIAKFIRALPFNG
jgi:hypothetical protein